MVGDIIAGDEKQRRILDELLDVGDLIVIDHFLIKFVVVGVRGGEARKVDRARHDQARSELKIY